MLTGVIILAVTFFTSRTLVYWKPLFYGETTGFPEQNTVSVFYANINSQNSKKSKLISYLQTEVPDLVILNEINQSWGGELISLEQTYPYSKFIVQEGNFGLGVLSQTHLKVERVFIDRENGIPALVLQVDTSQGKIKMAVLHAFPPIGSYGTLIRNQYLSALSHQLQGTEGPLLVCGDFNTTPWSAVFKAFLENSGLNLSVNHPTPHTWPAVSFLPKIPIDHCLSRGLKVVRYERGPDIGSDHWPLLIEILAGTRRPAETGK